MSIVSGFFVGSLLNVPFCSSSVPRMVYVPSLIVRRMSLMSSAGNFVPPDSAPVATQTPLRRSISFVASCPYNAVAANKVVRAAKVRMMVVPQFLKAIPGRPGVLDVPLELILPAPRQLTTKGGSAHDLGRRPLRHDLFHGRPLLQRPDPSRGDAGTARRV